MSSLNTCEGKLRRLRRVIAEDSLYEQSWSDESESMVRVRDGESVQEEEEESGEVRGPSPKGRTGVRSGTTSESPIVIGSPVRRNLGIGRQCAGRRSPGSTCSAGKPEKLRFTGSSEHRPGGAGWIGGEADAELDPECRRDPSGTDVRRADTVLGMVQARWGTRNSVGSGPVSVELREWLRRIDEARGILGRSAGMWLEGAMTLEAGDSARRA
jgi:hypothetical protein